MLQLKTSDIFWCFSDTGWILALFGCMMEPWTVGATLFIHHLPQFDPKVVEQVRRLIFQYRQTLRRNSYFKLKSWTLLEKMLFSEGSHKHNITLVLGFSKRGALNPSLYLNHIG